MKTFEEFKSKSIIHTKSEIQQFLRDFEVPESIVEEFNIDKIIEYLDRIGIFYGHSKIPASDFYSKQNWVFHFHPSPRKKFYKMFYVHKLATYNSADRAWVRNDDRIIIDFKSINDAKKYALSYIMNTIQFDSDYSIEKAKELVKKSKMKRTAKKFGI